MKGPKLLFTDTATDFVFKALGLKVKNKIIVDMSGNPVPALDGSSVKYKEFAGIVKDDDGSMKLVKGDLGSIMDYVKRVESDKQ